MRTLVDAADEFVESQRAERPAARGAPAGAREGRACITSTSTSISRSERGAPADSRRDAGWLERRGVVVVHDVAIVAHDRSRHRRYEGARRPARRRRHGAARGTAGVAAHRARRARRDRRLDRRRSSMPPERTGRRRRGRSRRPRRNGAAVRAEPAERARGAVARRARRRDRARGRRRQRRERRDARRGDVRRGDGHARRVARDARHRYRRRVLASTAAPTAARTTSAPRSATSPSTLDGPLCACGERGHWEAIASGTALGRMARELVARGGGAALVAAAGGDAGAVTGTHVGRRGRDRAMPTRARCSCSTPRTSRSGSPASRTSSIPSAS